MTRDLLPWEQPSLPATEEDLAIAAELDAGLSNLGGSIAAAGGVASGLPYLGINKLGEWNFGAENLEVENGSAWVLDIRTLRHGFVAWQEGKASGKVMVSVGELLPSEATLTPGKPWQPNFSCELVCMTGEDAGTKVLYETSSYGGRAAFDELASAIRRQKMKQDGRIFPVVNLLVRTYDHKAYGPINSPILKIIGWMGARDMQNVELPAPAMTQAVPVAATPAPEPARRRPEPVSDPAPARANRRRVGVTT